MRRDNNLSNIVPATQETHSKTIQVMVLREINAVYSDNQVKQSNVTILDEIQRYVILK
jgi:hypothetical protein